MSGRGLSSSRLPWAVGLLVLVGLCPHPCLPSTTQQVIPIAAEAKSVATPPTDSQQPASPVKRTTKVPILVYHHVSQTISEGSPGLRRLTVTAEVFAQQMQYLQDNGYHVITFSDVADFFENGKELPALPIIISFDDGWATQFEYALPSLEKYHYTATFFVVTDYIGRPGFISWPQLQTLLTDGMKIGSHSRSHPRLSKITDSAKLWDQIYDSKTILETQLETPVEEFAYPYGSYNAKAAELVKLAGYRAGRGCCSGIAHTSRDVFTLKAIMAPNDLEKFIEYIGGDRVRTARTEHSSILPQAGSQ
ncbi:MAG: polysaccharide deacetylase family protein [Alphaproteobacteria bacterium]|nr:polysaccharide deacetylase family protein [Alphaproteobacteria bacterium]